jgi:hypothetical protein
LRPSKRRRWIAATVPAALSLLAATSGLAAESAATAAPAGAQIQPQNAVIDPANLILFSVELDQLTLTDGLAAYGDATDPHLPLGELTRLLEMDVDVLPAEGRVVGRVGEARRSLIIDLKTGTAREGARSVQLSPDDIAVTAGEVYMKASAAERLLPMKFGVNPEALAIKITPEEPLPIQARQERMARLRGLGGDSIQNANEPGVNSPYRLVSLPAFDVQVAGGAQTEKPQTPFRYDIRAAADLFYGNFQGYLGSDEAGRPSSARVLFERQSIEGRLLGPLKARVVSAGDVYTPSLSLGPRGLGGRGVAISTVPLDQTNVFNRIDLRGELPIGYDVELYINDVLRSGQNTPAKGRYEFLNVPLSPGVNVVRIVTYGPRGERNEETRIINVGGGMLARGEATFEFGAVEQEREVIEVNGGGGTPSRTEGGLRAVAALNYGLSSVITVAAGAAIIPEEKDVYRQIYNLGVRTSLLGFATQIDAAADNRGGSAGFLGLAGQVAGASVVLRHAEFRGGFLDENGPGFDFTRPTRQRTELSADASLEFAGRIIPVSLRAARYAYADNSLTYTGSFRASSTIGSVLASAGLEYERTETQSTTQDRLTGFFAGSTYRDYAWQIRATLDYDILPELAARTLAVSADRDLTPNWAVRLGVGQPLDELDATNLTVASIHRLRFGDLAISGDYNNRDQSWRLGAQFSFGLNYNPAEHGYQVTRPGPGSGGSVLFHAFMDDNGNGVFDPGEEPVKDITVEGGVQRAVTDDQGRAFVPGIGSGPTARLTVALDQLEAASVKTPPTTLALRPRAGATIQVEYPIQPTGDVIVRLVLRRPDGSAVGLAAARLVMTDARGRTFEAGTEFDGTAIFSGVPLGSYRVELDPDQAKRLRMRLTKPISVDVKSDSGFGADVEGEVMFESRPQEEEAQVSVLESSAVQAIG